MHSADAVTYTSAGFSKTLIPARQASRKKERGRGSMPPHVYVMQVTARRPSLCRNWRQSFTSVRLPRHDCLPAGEPRFESGDSLSCYFQRYALSAAALQSNRFFATLCFLRMLTDSYVGRRVHSPITAMRDTCLWSSLKTTHGQSRCRKVEGTHFLCEWPLLSAPQPLGESAERKP